jgi:hypothetical protein
MTNAASATVATSDSDYVQRMVVTPDGFPLYEMLWDAVGTHRASTCPDSGAEPPLVWSKSLLLHRRWCAASPNQNRRGHQPDRWPHHCARRGRTKRRRADEGRQPALLDARLAYLRNSQQTSGRSASLRGSPRRRRPASTTAGAFDRRGQGARDEGSGIDASEVANAPRIGRTSV